MYYYYFFCDVIFKFCIEHPEKKFWSRHWSFVPYNNRICLKKNNLLMSGFDKALKKCWLPKKCNTIIDNKNLKEYQKEEQMFANYHIGIKLCNLASVY